MKGLIKIGTVLTAAVMLCGCANTDVVSIPSPEEMAKIEQEKIESITLEEIVEKNDPKNIMHTWEAMTARGTYKCPDADYEFTSHYRKDGDFIAYDYIDHDKNGDVYVSNIAQGAGSYAKNDEVYFEIYPMANYNENVSQLTWDYVLNNEETEKTREMVDGMLVIESGYSHEEDYVGDEHKLDVQCKYTINPKNMMVMAFEMKEYEAGTDKLHGQLVYTVEFDKPITTDHKAMDAVYNGANGVCEITVFDLKEDGEIARERTYKVAKGVRAYFYDEEDAFMGYYDEACTKEVGEEKIDTTADALTIYIKAK